MIFYFSGTGNSEAVAGAIAEGIGEKAELVTHIDASSVVDDGSDFGIVFPVYSWGVPAPVEDFLSRLPESAVDSLKKRKAFVWVVMTCGDETGDAPAVISRMLGSRGLTADTIKSVIMPNTYVLLPGFGTDSGELAERKLNAARERVKNIIKSLQLHERGIDVVAGSWPRLKTGLVYPLFRRWGINPSKWKWGEACISCGICERRCPMKNISLIAGHPVWGDNCVSCLACYHYCPVKAIEYGSATKKKGQYHFPLNVENWISCGE